MILYIYIQIFITHSSVDGQLDWFEFFTIVTKATKPMGYKQLYRGHSAVFKDSKGISLIPNLLTPKFNPYLKSLCN